MIQWFDMTKKVLNKLNWNGACTYFYPKEWWMKVRRGENPPIQLVKNFINLN